MIERHEIDLIVESIARAVVPLIKRVEELEKRPQVVNTVVEAPPIDTAPIVAEVLKQIPPPINGRDAGPVDTAAIAADVLRQIPPVRDGKDAEPVDIDSIVLRVLDAVPKPQNGKDAPPVDTDALVQRVLGLIPTPKDGRDGKDGEPGQSIQGEKGEPGQSIKGEPGERGESGKDCDMEAVQRMIDDLVTQKEQSLRLTLGKEMADAFASLPIPQDGAPGEPGKPGESIHPDTVKLMVLSEVQKAVADIPKPQDGKQGEPGRDALQIDVLSAIDDTRSYPRGTYAHFNGSLVRAVRNTEPGEVLKSGWEVIVDGFLPVEIIQGDDLRSFTFVHRTLSGMSTKQSFTVPVMIYEGIWKSGPYKRGAMVTFDNQLWHCNEDTWDSPASSKSWQLAARKPRDGKPGEKGDKGDPGNPGKDGRDLRYQ